MHTILEMHEYVKLKSVEYHVVPVVISSSDCCNSWLIGKNNYGSGGKEDCTKEQDFTYWPWTLAEGTFDACQDYFLVLCEFYLPTF